ncbi:MAG: coproporphyrinogen-III oxidase family protein [bacterium]
MAGIYIHIPFCRQKCNYCNFFSLATTKFHDEFTDALLKEIELTKDYLGGDPVETIYFGGGTPSLLSVKQLEEILKKLRDASPSPGFSPTSDPTPSPSPEGEGRIRHPDYTPPPTPPQQGRGAPEITLEMNPDDVTPEYLTMLYSSAINRVSLGVQSFFNEDLQYLGRIHTAEQARKAIEEIRDALIPYPVSRNPYLSVDLIYGIPTLTNEHWRENLQIVIDLGIPHISAYALTVEPKTPLAWQIGKGIRHPVSDDQASEQFEILMEVMEEHGYIQYEISNFCLPGYESRHNSNYWKGIPYLGLGPSAHSYNGTSRRWNPLHLTSYIQGIRSGIPQFEEEILTITQQYNEYVMTSIRTLRGCDLYVINLRYGQAYETYFRNQAIRHLASGHFTESSGIFTLTNKGKLLADGIAADLFYSCG